MAKRGQGEGSISKRPDGTWWARISVGRDENGKRKRKAFYGRTRKEVQEKLTAALNDVNNNVYIEPSNMTVRQWGDLWLKEYKKPALRPTTYRNYFELLKSYIYPHFGEIKLKNLRNDIIQKGINDLSEKGIPPYTVRSAHEILYRALEQAVKNELLAKNIAKGVTLPAEIKKPSRALTLEEQERFVALTKEFSGGDAFLMSLATGMRIGEVLALTWDDIDWDNRVVTVNKTLSYVKDPDNPEDKWHNLIGPSKTKCSNRKIPLFPAVIELLQAIKAQQEADMSVTITTLRKMRIGKGFSQESMAEKVGITYGRYQSYEHGTKRPDLPTIIKIADALRCGLSELLVESPNEYGAVRCQGELRCTLRTEERKYEPKTKKDGDTITALRNKRVEKGLEQKELAQKAGIP